MAAKLPSNPYTHFLGLPEEITQPDHYQLLDLERFNSDPQVIKEAAAAQTEKLRKWQNNDECYSLVRRLEMEVASAMLLLADPKKRQAYDQTLSASAPPQAPQTSPKIPLWGWSLGGGLLLILIVGAVLFPKTNTGTDQTSDQPTNPQSKENLNQPKPVTHTKETRNDNLLNMPLIWCPPGSFVMGSPESETGHRTNETQAEVTLSDGFWLGQTEVTQEQWRAVMETAPWDGQESPGVEANTPATYIHWKAAMDFCDQLTERERDAKRLTLDWAYTLPSEAQWEYACRAGTTTAFSFAENESQLGDYAWYADSAAQGEDLAPRPVGGKKPNPWGFYDMHGNVFEWCRDGYRKSPSGGPDPVAAIHGKLRVGRSGSWSASSFPQMCRSAFRRRFLAKSASNELGFRVALVRTDASTHAPPPGD
ncbi:MAG: SUMF1/EgtB/PvdO family nonheme iron enzyme [Planctomycetaceae bacterium]|nr:SUMF1/EgtB/PvdO family nonheme iron enzyme [Planctomycetaceae bacterium]